MPNVGYPLLWGLVISVTQGRAPGPHEGNPRSQGSPVGVAQAPPVPPAASQACYTSSGQAVPLRDPALAKPCQERIPGLGSRSP